MIKKNLRVIGLLWCPGFSDEMRGCNLRRIGVQTKAELRWGLEGILICLDSCTAFNGETRGLQKRIPRQKSLVHAGLMPT